MSKGARHARLTIVDAAEAFVLRAALERALADAEASRARGLLQRWVHELDAQLGPQRTNVLNLDGSLHEEPAAAVVERIFRYWQTAMRRPRALFDSKRQRLIERRLAEYGEADLLRAIDGCVQSPFHQGDNPLGTRYDDLALIFRDSAHVESFIQLAEQPTRSRSAPAASYGAAGRHERSRAALDEFLNSTERKP